MLQLNQQLFAAVYEDGSIVDHPESPILADSRRGVGLLLDTAGNEVRRERAEGKIEIIPVKIVRA